MFYKATKSIKMFNLGRVLLTGSFWTEVVDKMQVVFSLYFEVDSLKLLAAFLPSMSQ